MSGIEHEYIDLILEQIEAQKRDLITERLIELDLSILKTIDHGRRFKKFTLEKLPDGVEKLWYDDGTIEGYLVICLQTHVAHDGKGRVGFQVIEL